MSNPLPLVIANLKANKSWDQVSAWIDEVASVGQNFHGTIIFCPSHPFLAASFGKISSNGINLKLGAQDVSRFEQGAYTGEVAASQIADLVKFAIIGHSERRKYFGEKDQDVIEKVKLLIAAKITPILCISDINQAESYKKEDQTIIKNAGEIIFVYEPPSAISGGGEFRPDDPNDANKQAGKIKEIIGKEIVTIYGGSINPENAKEFFSKEHLKGGLVGQASLDPKQFIGIVKALE